MYNNNNKKNSDHNGFHYSVHPISQEDNQPFPSGNSERDNDDDLDRSSQPLSEQGKENLRVLRRFYISLIVTGIVVGGFFTWGVITILSQWDLINPPEKPQLDIDKSSVTRN